MLRAKEMVGRPPVLAGLAVVAGIAIGLFLGWVVFPVEWTDAAPDSLRSDLQVDYMRMVIDSYSVNRNADLAMQRYEALGEDGPAALAEVAANPGEVSDTSIQNFYALIEIYQAEAPAGTPTPPAGAGGAAAQYLLPVCGLTAVLGLLLGGAVLWRSRAARRERSRGRTDEPSDAYAGMPAEETVGEVYRPGAAAGQASAPASTPRKGAEAPLAMFRTIYTLGDDLYDDSFSIESPAGDFLGECGVGLGDLIGVGEPKKVTALEIWLFDKNDIQTVTKVLLSRFAFNDHETRARLAAKGDPVLAASGGVVTLETASLLVEVRVVDLVYAESALPAESFFERLTIELRASRKSG
ncbi:MAG: hypothetical protein MUO23_04125 [Anaerolineales bacterium]|nr:hypothetical protein [Anaerolineales bacterium]